MELVLAMRALPITMLDEPQAERPTDAELLNLLADHYDVEPEEVIRWIDSFDPRVAIAQLRLDLGISAQR